MVDSDLTSIALACWISSWPSRFRFLQGLSLSLKHHRCPPGFGLAAPRMELGLVLSLIPSAAGTHNPWSLPIWHCFPICHNNSVTKTFYHAISNDLLVTGHATSLPRQRNHVFMCQAKKFVVYLLWLLHLDIEVLFVVTEALTCCRVGVVAKLKIVPWQVLQMTMLIDDVDAKKQCTRSTNMLKKNLV